MKRIRLISFVLLQLPLVLNYCSLVPDKADRAEEKATKIIEKKATDSINIAIDLLHKILNKDSSKRSVYLKLSYCYRIKKEYEESLKILNLYKKRKGQEDIGLKIEKARSLYCIGNKEKAVHKLEDALRLVHVVLRWKKREGSLRNKV